MLHLIPSENLNHPDRESSVDVAPLRPVQKSYVCMQVSCLHEISTVPGDFASRIAQEGTVRAVTSVRWQVRCNDVMALP